MSLTRVTITGADNAVKPSDLLMLSEEFSFVEWGILISESRAGTARYPSGGWMNDLYDTFLEHVAHDAASLSAHFCGSHMRALLEWDCSKLHSFDNVFRRVQLNSVVKHVTNSAELAGLVRLIVGHPAIEFILQIPIADALETAAAIARNAKPWPADDGVRNVSALFDPSGGTGSRPEAWPNNPALRLGYAGGITPDNVVATIEAIRATTSNAFWVDMESGIRTDDQFDLDKVRRVLELATPFVRAPQRGA